MRLWILDVDVLTR